MVTTEPPTWPPVWEQRLRARQVELPEWAEDAPGRTCVVATSHGVLQVHSWEVGSGRLVQATDRPQGTTTSTISPDGRWLWWFDDTDGDEFGSWRRQPFGSPPGHGVESPVPLPASYPAGLLLARDGTAVVGRSDVYGTTVHLVVIGPTAQGTDTPLLLYRSEHDAAAAALSRDGNLVALEHSESGDNRHPALRVLRADTGAPVGDLDDGPGRGLTALEFAPVDGDSRLLVLHERRGRTEVAVWDAVAATRTDITLLSGEDPLPGEVTEATWFPDGRTALVAVDHEARTRLYRCDVRTGQVTPVGPRTGTVSDARARPDGEVWARWSSAEQPRVVLAASTGRQVVSAGGPPAPPSVPVRDVWAEGPAGPVHALLRLPGPASAEPCPVVVDLHGGPAAHRSDSFSPWLAAWADHGFAVVSVNYRGSTGYGSAWRDALEGRVGLTELEDVAAVHQHLVEAGVVDPERSVLAGASWGGYLTLLGLGVQPERWSVGLADVPVADYVTAYADEMPDLQAFDRSLFGGSPSEVPGSYRRSSPLTYVGDVRAPVLILAGRNDPRCPLRQIHTYLGTLRGRRDYPGPAELYTFDAGHGSVVDDEEVAQLRRQLDFVHAHLPGVTPPTAPNRS